MKCFKCNEELSVDNFYVRNARKRGYSSNCKACIKSCPKTEKRKIYEKAYREEHLEKYKLYRKDYYKVYNKTEKQKIYQKNYNHTYNQTEHRRLCKKYRHLVRRAFKVINKEKSICSAKFLGYTPVELGEHLKQFINKPCLVCNSAIIILDNNSHIDHILPLKLDINEQTAQELSRLCNLRLICAPCNLNKSDTIM
jgi:hypothetical protein